MPIYAYLCPSIYIYLSIYLYVSIYIELWVNPTPPPQVDVDKANTEGDTPLHAAARAGRADMCEMLLGAGAMFTRNVAGKTPAVSSIHIDS